MMAACATLVRLGLKLPSRLELGRWTSLDDQVTKCINASAVANKFYPFYPLDDRWTSLRHYCIRISPGMDPVGWDKRNTLATT